MSTLCRTCGQEARHSRTLFGKDDTYILFDVLKLTGIWFTDKPGVPTHICMSCLVDLKEAVAVRERCIRMNKFWFGESDTAGKEVELKILPRVFGKSSKEEDNITFNTTNQVLDPLISKETIKVENVSLHSDSKIGNPDHQPLEELSSPQSRKKRGRPPKRQGQSLVIKPAQKKSEKGATRRKWARAKRIHAKAEGLYFCDQCGKSFSEKGNFNVHLTRHTGLKEFECEECGRKEFTLHLLKLHVRIKHRGELPYVCKYCGQRFDNCIKRLRHERGHKESPVHRPHTCAICKKAFKDKITLRFHAVVHTGEQAFHCDLCQAHFNRKSSLRTHFRSKQHMKRAEEQVKEEE